MISAHSSSPRSSEVAATGGRKNGVARNWAWILAGIVALELAVFIPLAAVRMLDSDEGVYGLASRLVMEGKVPYRDFFLPQAPLVPYSYGAWMWVFGDSWLTGRSLSVALAVVLGVLLAVDARRRGGTATAVLIAVLYTFTSAIFIWLTVIKTYALSTLLLFVAYMLVERASARLTTWLAAGVSFGLAVDARAMFVVALPPLAYAAWRSRRRCPRATLALMLGASVGLLPGIALFLSTPRMFLFDNLGAQAVRSQSGLIGDLGQKLSVLHQLVTGWPQDVSSVQFVLLIAACGALAALARGSRVPLALQIAILLSVVSLLPTPAYTQYFCTVFPFLLATAAGLGSIRGLFPQAIWRAVIAGGVLLYFAAGLADIHRYGPFSTGAWNERITHVEQVTRTLDAHIRRGDLVLASWPGYLVGSVGRPVSGTECDCGTNIASSISAGKQADARLLSTRAIDAIVRARVPRAIVVREWGVPGPRPHWPAILAEGQYRLVGTVGAASVYVRR